MDNKALADLVRTELSKVTSAIYRLGVKISELTNTPREYHKEGVTPQQASHNKDDSTPGKMFTLSPTPTNPHNPKHRANPRFPRRTVKRRVWRQVKRIFFKKDRLERAGILFGIAYAVTTVLQWRTMIAANEVSAKTLEISNRAYVSIVRVEPNSSDALSLRLIVQNAGHIPSSGFAAEVVSSVDQWDGTKQFSPEPQANRMYGGTETNIPPGAGDYSIDFRLPESFAKYREMIPSEHAIFTVVGQVDYGTGFRNRAGEDLMDASNFCFMYGGSQSAEKITWHPCALGDATRPFQSPGNMAGTVIENYQKQHREKK
jgi:hypothetical protein